MTRCAAGFESWFSLKYAEALASCSVPLQKVKSKSINTVIEHATQSAADAAERWFEIVLLCNCDRYIKLISTMQIDHWTDFWLDGEVVLRLKTSAGQTNWSSAYMRTGFGIHMKHGAEIGQAVACAPGEAQL